MKKYPKIKEFGSEDISRLQADGSVFIEEKLDGANFRFEVKDDEFVFGSRNVEGLGNNKEQFKPAVTCIEDRVEPNGVVQVMDEKFGHHNFTFFGECMTRHTLDYDWDKIDGIVMFDIYNEEEEKFITFVEKQDVFDKLGFDTAPLITIVDKVTREDLTIPESEYRDGKAEGIVLKNYNTQEFSKKRADEFFEKNDNAFGKPKTRATNDSEKFVSKYVTNARIEKIIYKIRDEYNRDIEMKIIPQLMDTVYKDIWEEEWDEIIWNNWELNFKEIRNMIGTRCEEVLRQVINKESFRGEV